MTLKILALGLGGAALLAFGAAAALADNNAATITKDFGCAVYDGNGALQIANGGTIEVSTNGGTTSLVCKASGLDNPTGHAVRWDESSPGKGCSTFAGPSDEWSDTVSASGNVTLVCKVRS